MTDQDTAQRQERRVVNVSAALIAGAQPRTLAQPTEHPLQHLSEAPQTAAALAKAVFRFNRAVQRSAYFFPLAALFFLGFLTFLR
jgi:hypothetical protein